jgi:glycerophosphoryl diester phosphodiesterase
VLKFGNKTFVLIIALIFFVLLSLFFYNKSNKNNFRYDNQILQLFNQQQYKFIAHAGGGIDEYTYTNSLESVNLSISKGYKLIEIDLRETKDKHFVGVNTWKKYKKNNFFKEEDINDEPIYLEEFKKIKIFKKYTPLTVDKINEIFTKNNDLILVIDKTNNFKKINKDFSFDKKRIMVEVFGKKNYLRSIKDGIYNPMFSATSEDYDFIIKNDIKMITAHSADITKNTKIYKTLIDRGVKVFVYSSNNKKFIEENLGNTFSAVYTDFWDIENNNCFSDECITY